MEAITQDVNHPVTTLSLSHRSMTTPLELKKEVLMLVALFPEPKDINHRLCLVQLNFLIINFK
jgi:hypothetical protein